MIIPSMQSKRLDRSFTKLSSLSHASGVDNRNCCSNVTKKQELGFGHLHPLHTAQASDLAHHEFEHKGFSLFKRILAPLR